MPHLPDIGITSTFTCCWHWLTSSTLAALMILYETPMKAQGEKFLRILLTFYWFSYQIQMNHSELNTSLLLREKLFCVVLFANA